MQSNITIIAVCSSPVPFIFIIILKKKHPKNQKKKNDCEYINLYQLCFYSACQTVYYGPHCDIICNSSCLNQRLYSEKEDCLQVYPCLNVLSRQVQLLSKRLPSLDQPIISDTLSRKNQLYFFIRLISRTSTQEFYYFFMFF